MQVYSIREAAATNLKRLAEEFGAEWAQAQIVPLVRSSFNPHLAKHQISYAYSSVLCAAWTSSMWKISSRLEMLESPLPPLAALPRSAGDGSDQQSPLSLSHDHPAVHISPCSCVGPRGHLQHNAASCRQRCKRQVNRLCLLFVLVE